MSKPFQDEHEMKRGTTSLTIRALAPSFQEIGVLTLIFFFYVITNALTPENSINVSNRIGPIFLAATLLYYNWRLILIDSKSIWTALFWFRLSTAAYFGIGTATIYFLNDFTQAYIKTFYFFDESEVFKFNIIMIASTVTTLVSAHFGVTLFARGKAELYAQNNERSWLNLFRIGRAFLMIGLVVTYLFQMPQSLGWTTSEIPSSILGLSRLTMLGIFMLTLWSLERARWFLPVITTITIIEMTFQLLLFAKSNILLTFTLYLLAYLWRNVSSRKIFIIGLSITILYAFLQPLVGYCRYALDERYGQDAIVGFNERFDIFSSYFDRSTAEVEQDGERQGALSRISYVNAATLVIAQYDRGAPSSWPKMLPAVFVPRLIWPGKPIITDVGLDVYEVATGRRTSSSGAGIAPSAYWAWGWWGIVLLMPAYGFIVGLLTATMTKILHSGKWIFFPIVLASLQIGFRTDGHFLPDVAGASVIVLGLYGALFALNYTFKTKRTQTSDRLARDS